MPVTVETTNQFICVLEELVLNPTVAKFNNSFLKLGKHSTCLSCPASSSREFLILYQADYISSVKL